MNSVACIILFYVPIRNLSFTQYELYIEACRAVYSVYII